MNNDIIFSVVGTCVSQNRPTIVWISKTFRSEEQAEDLLSKLLSALMEATSYQEHTSLLLDLDKMFPIQIKINNGTLSSEDFIDYNVIKSKIHDK